MGNISHVLSHVECVARGMKMSSVTPLGEDTWKLVPGSSRRHSMGLFSLC